MTEIKGLDSVFIETLKRLSSIKNKERSGILYPTCGEHEKITGNEVPVGYQLTLSTNDNSQVITWILSDYVEEKDENVIIVSNIVLDQIVKIMNI